MGYVAGVDLGTTYSAAAVLDASSLAAVDLGTHSTVMPSVVAVRSGGEVLTGTNAERRLVSQPSTVAREFKRRLGDATPILLGGTPYATADLTGYLLASIIEVITERRDGPPDVVGLSHPANYGEFKLDLLRSAARTAGVASPVFVAEPVAAAVHYSLTERVVDGDVIAVYDLGGGTFDATVVRRTADAFEVIGTPDGMDRFGGIDLDEAVLGHVRRSLEGDLGELDRSDPAVVSALSRLRDDCREAKEALSGDAEVEIPVMLPGLHTEVRLTRPEFEDMIRPRVSETIDVVRRTIRSAGVEVDDVSRVLLVGGSSRIPLIGEMITQELGKPVALDAHPKLTVALGTARVAGGQDIAPEPPAAPGTDLPPIVAASETAELAGIAALATPGDAPTVPIPAAQEPVPAPPQSRVTEPITVAAAPEPVPPGPPSSGSGRPDWVKPTAIVAVVLALVGAGALALSQFGGDGDAGGTTTTIATGDVDVPSVVGREEVAARDTLAAAGLAVEVRYVEVTSDNPDNGFVIAQSIPPDTTVEAGTSISITVGRVGVTTTPATDPATTPPTTPAPTTTSTTTTTSSSTTTTAPLTAEQLLAQLIDEDGDLVASIAENWLPQLSAKRIGLVIEGTEFGFDEILADHLAHRAAHGAVLIDGGTYNFNLDGDQMTGWYMSLVPEPFVTFEGALAWCRDANIDRDNCFAKFLSADPLNFERTIRLQ